MSVRQIVMYQAVCDGCGKVCQESETSEHLAWADPESALWDAACGWWLINGLLAYCVDCLEYDEESDEYRPKVSV